tara:strand:+ start:357 stop:593 length:237 start_codon:yes stop_codon:yes gene_type:complete
MKKGDLVLRRRNVSAEKYQIPDFSVGIIVSDPYAAIFSQKGPNDKAHFSEEKIVVDILVGTLYVKKCPIDLISRYYED